MSENHEYPLLAIQCIAYNQENYIRDTLEGFVMQRTNFRFVAIVHDDASIDNTAIIIKEYAEKYPDIIKPIFEIENQYSKPGKPLLAIMRSAIKATGAKYIAICEGDDFWTDPYKLQQQVDFLENNPDFIGCYSDVDCIDYVSEYPEIIKSSRIVSGWGKSTPSFEEQLMNQYYLAPPTWVYRASFEWLEKRDYIDSTYAMTLDFLGKYNFKYMDEVFGVYRVVPSGVSHVVKLSDYIKRIKGLWQTQRVYLKRFPHLVSELNKKKIRLKIFNFMEIAILNQDEELLLLIHRYALVRKKYNLILKLAILRLPIMQSYLKNKYRKKGLEI